MAINTIIVSDWDMITIDDANRIDVAALIQSMIDLPDGEQVASVELEAPPVFDSLIAANGSLYFTTTDGNLVRLAAEM